MSTQYLLDENRLMTLRLNALQVNPKILKQLHGYNDEIFDLAGESNHKAAQKLRDLKDYVNKLENINRGVK